MSFQPEHLSILQFALDQSDADYAQKRNAAIQDLKRLGAFQRVADLVHLPNDGVHLDIGTKTGDHILAIHKKYPSASLISIDENVYFLTPFFASLSAAGIRSNIVADSVVKADPTSGIIRTKFLNTFDEAKLRMLSVRKAITLVFDDIRTKELLMLFLKAQKIDRVDSGSFVLPGVSWKTSMEGFPLTRELLVNERQQSERAQQVLAEVKQAVFAVMTSLIKPGGTFVIMERILRTSVFDVHHLSQDLKARMGSYADQWEIGDLKEVGQNAPEQREKDGRFVVQSGIKDMELSSKVSDQQLRHMRESKSNIFSVVAQQLIKK